MVHPKEGLCKKISIFVTRLSVCRLTIWRPFCSSEFAAPACVRALSEQISTKVEMDLDKEM
jgi:hypothetical protein